MTSAGFARLLLRARLAALAAGPMRLGAGSVLAVAALAVAWLLPQGERLRGEHQAALSGIEAPSRVAAAEEPAQAGRNLALFYDSLGDKRYVEQQVRTLFALAAKIGLTLSRGEYRTAHDAAAGVDTYRVILPVKGSYAAIWQFGMLALRAMPFASLDEIGFKRDAIGQAVVEARLHFTLYLGRRQP